MNHSGDSPSERKDSKPDEGDLEHGTCLSVQYGTEQRFTSKVILHYTPKVDPPAYSISVHLSWCSVPRVRGQISSIRSLNTPTPPSRSEIKFTSPTWRCSSGAEGEERQRRGRTHWHARVCRGRWTRCLWVFLHNKWRPVAAAGWDFN